MFGLSSPLWCPSCILLCSLNYGTPNPFVSHPLVFSILQSNAQWQLFRLADIYRPWCNRQSTLITTFELLLVLSTSKGICCSLLSVHDRIRHWKHSLDGCYPSVLLSWNSTASPLIPLNWVKRLKPPISSCIRSHPTSLLVQTLKLNSLGICTEQANFQDEAFCEQDMDNYMLRSTAEVLRFY